jgi:hypothetical protein
MARPARRFALRLALALGQPDVDAMLGGLSAAQLHEWMAFYRLEPWGFWEENKRTAVLASTTANTSGNVKRLVAPADFMPKDPLTPAQLIARAKALLGGNTHGRPR